MLESEDYMTLTVYKPVSQLPEKVIYQLFEVFLDKCSIPRQQKDIDFVKDHAMKYLQHHISFEYQVGQSYFFSVKPESEGIAIALQTINDKEKHICEKHMASFLKEHYSKLKADIKVD